MIRDITIGQFFPGNSILHKLDPRLKIVITLMMIISLFVCNNIISLCFLFLLSLISIMISQISFKVILKGLRTIILIIVFTSVLQIFYNKDGIVLFKPFPNIDFCITSSGVINALFITVRIIALIFYSSLLTYTTSPTMLTDAIERLLSPLKIIKINVHSVSMMMTIALRFIPTLIEEINIIMSAQKSRGAELETGSLAKRAKALVPIFIPLFVSSFRRAYELAYAMECRCYNGDNGRTRMKIMKMSLKDYVTLILIFLIIAAVVYLSFFLKIDNILFERVI